MHVFVAPSLLQNSVRASNGRAAIALAPLGCEGLCWHRHASGTCHFALPEPDMGCLAASWPRTLEPCSGLVEDFRCSTSPFVAALVAHSVFFPSSLVEALSQPGRLTGPTIAGPPSLTFTFPTTID